MTAVGAGSIFYFQPITRQGAFAQGFGLLAVLMTATPANLAGGLQGINDNLPGLDPVVEEVSLREASSGARLYKAAYSAQATYTEIQDRRGPDKYDVHLVVNFPDGLPAEVDTMIRQGSLRGRLHNEDTDETWNLFRTSGGTVRRSGNSLVIHAGVPARSPSARLWVRIEAQGYAIQVESYQASIGGEVDWVVDLTPSNVPLFVQRLGKSYWF